MTTSFPIVPASGSFTLAILLVPFLGLLVAVVCVGVSTLGSQRATFEVSQAGLVLHGDFYGRTIPSSAIIAKKVRVVDLARARKLTPVRRTLGTGLPGYRAGWFRLANGEKALLYVTDESRVVYVPTTAGYAVMLSPLDPDGLVARLREIAATPSS